MLSDSMIFCNVAFFLVLNVCALVHLFHFSIEEKIAQNLYLLSMHNLISNLLRQNVLITSQGTCRKLKSLVQLTRIDLFKSLFYSIKVTVFVCIFSHFVISAKGIKMKNGTKVAQLDIIKLLYSDNTTANILVLYVKLFELIWLM